MFKNIRIHLSHSYGQVGKKIVSMNQSHHSLSTNAKGTLIGENILYEVIHLC